MAFMSTAIRPHPSKITLDSLTIACYLSLIATLLESCFMSSDHTDLERHRFADAALCAYTLARDGQEFTSLPPEEQEDAVTNLTADLRLLAKAMDMDGKHLASTARRSLDLKAVERKRGVSNGRGGQGA